MAENVKTYQIVINGITESVKQVTVLNNLLKNLEERINALQSKSVNIGSSTKSASTGGGSKSSSSSEVSALNEINKLKKQEEQLNAKIAASQNEIFKSVDATKAEYKKVLEDQKAIAAQERYTADQYTHTMVGLKQKLADIKQIIQTTVFDEPDGADTINKLTREANELNNKLKEMEQSYGQFGRNVGNYASAFEGMQKLSINIGGVVREFNSAREASKTLKNELIGLEAAGSGNTEVAKQLRTEYYKLQSAMEDATKSSKAMDEAMDMMQSFTAMASVGQGLKGFFGFDDSEIQRSIQRLVALQNVLKGIETLRKQMETSEGIGKLLTKGSGSIDKMVAGLTGAKLATEGLTMGSKAATVAVRGLSMALKGIGIGLVLEAINLLVQGIEWVSEKLTKWAKGDADLIKEEKLLDAQLDYTNKKLEERNAELSRAYYQGVITNEEYFRKQLELTTNAINEQIKALKEKAELEGGGFSERINNGITGEIEMSVGGGTQHVKDLKELTTLWKFYRDAVLEGKDAMSKLSDEFGSVSAWFKSLIYNLDDTKDDLVKIGQVAIGEFLSKYEHAMQTMVVDTKAGEKELAELKKQMDDNEMLRTIFMNLDQYVPVEAFRKKIQKIINLIRGVKTEMGDLEQRTVEQVLRSEQLKIDAMKDGAAKRQAQRDLDKKKELADATLTAEDKANIEKKYQQRRIREEKAANQKSQSEAKKNARELLEAERDLSNLRIANMKEGLNKVLKQLEEERKLRLAKVEADGKLVAERQAEINILYDKKILDAKKEWAEKVEKAYRDMWDNIYNYSFETSRKITELLSSSYEIGQTNWNYKESSPMGKMPDYGVQGVNQLSKSTQADLKIEQNTNKKLAEIFVERSTIIQKYWNERKDFEYTAIEAIYKQEKELENENYQKELRDAAAHSEDLQKQAEKSLKDGLTQEQYDEILERNIAEHQQRVEAITAQHDNNLLKLTQERISKIRNVELESFNQRLQELRDFQTSIVNLESKQPVYNIWGITNFKKTDENNRIILDAYKKQADEILKLKKDLQNKLNEGKISFDDFQVANRELDSFADNVGQKMDKVKHELSDWGHIETFVRDIQQYVQASLQAMNDIMNAVWDAQDAQFEKEQEYLDKLNEELDKKLDEQQDIVQKHKDAIDDIESELAEARGDRREHLISQLNEEMAAQRAAQKEEQRIQRQKEVAERKQQELDKKRRKEEYERNVIQAFISWHMAIANGLATQPFMPLGIAMGALATVLGGIQYALVKSQKPYAKGGVLEGPSHKQGGIPVGNTGIEVEGKEYVVRKKSTTPNVELLDYINRSERKLSLDDFIDFYSSGKLKKNISSISPKRTFADGGTIPTITNDYAFDDRLLSAFEDYSNRPVYVSVVDINNRQDAVKNVQVLAGLSD